MVCQHIIGGQLTQIQIQRAIKILLPREYVSREHSHRHIAANYLPGLMRIAKNHNVQKYLFFIVQLSTGPQVVKLIFLEDNGKPITSCSASDQNIKFRAILFVENKTDGFNCDSPVKVARWLNIDRSFSEVHLKKVSCSLFELSEDSRSIFCKSKESVQIQQDALLAKNISLCLIPLEYVEVEDIVD